MNVERCFKAIVFFEYTICVATWGLGKDRDQNPNQSVDRGEGNFCLLLKAVL
jgi:hypothetical protein